MMDSYIDYAENTGRISANKYREKQITQENASIKKLKAEYDSLKKKMDEALASGSLKKNSEGYYEMLNALNAINEDIIDTTANIAELNKSIRETNWEIFDKAAESIANMRDELEFLYDILDEKMFDDNGKVTNSGIAGFGILSSQYNISMAEAQKYANAITDINKQITNDKYNQDLIERRQELYESQRKAIQQANDYKEAIRDLVKEGIDAQIDSLKELVSNYEKLMDSQKDELDYSKKVASAQDNINRIQKQLNAYENDDSEEGATRRQKLRNDLKNAQDSLAQTQEERRISETKKMLSDLQDEYEDVLNARLDNLDALVKAVVDGVDTNAKTVKTAIETAAKDVGYVMTNDVATIFADSSNALVSYFTGGDFVNKVTTIANAVSGIESYYKTAQSKAEETSSSSSKSSSTKSTSKSTGKKTVVGQKSSSSASSLVVNPSTLKSTTKGNKTSTSLKATVVGQKSSSSSVLTKKTGWVKSDGKWYYYDKNGKTVSGWHNLTKDGKKGWYYFHKNTHVLQFNKWVNSSGITNYPKQGDYYVGADGLRVANGKKQTKNGYKTFDKNGKWKGYKSGVRSVGADGLYWTNEGVPETIVRKSDGAILTKLNARDTVLNGDATKNMWDFSNNPMKFLRGLGINSATGNDVDLVINLNGLRNASEFMTELRKDKKFERFIQEITIGRVNGHGSLAKNAIAFQ